MTGVGTLFAGSFIPPRSPAFLAVLAVHIPAGLTCVVCGAGAALSPKRRGLHPTFGTVYYWSLAVVFVTTVSLTIMRTQNLHLLVLGTIAFVVATIGRIARRHRWRHWVPLHVTGMGGSYTFLLIAFYVDNAKSLPVWRDLPFVAVWVIPAAIGLTLTCRALLRYINAFHQHGSETRLAKTP